MEEDCDLLRDILKGLEENPDIDILAPFSTLLFNVPLAEDDVDESLEYLTLSTHVNPGSGLDDAEVHIEVEDALGELSASPDNSTNSDISQHQIVKSQVHINGKLQSKAHAVANFTKYGKHTGSTDCLH